MCIKRRRKTFQSQRSDRTPLPDGTPTESSRDPALRTAEETNKSATTEIKVVRTFTSQQKQSSVTTSQPTNNNNNNNNRITDFSSSNSPKFRLQKCPKENICFIDTADNNNNNNNDYNNNNNNGDGGGKTLENESGAPIQLGIPSTRNIERKFETPNPTKFEKKENGKKLQPPQHQHQQPAAKSPQTHTNTQEEIIKLDKTQDVPNESAAPATTQTPTKINQNHGKPQNERTKEFPPKKRHHPTVAAPTTTDYKETTTPLLTDFLNKKIEKENFEELSRIPIVRTANIKHEKFPYSNQDHQDTMAGISSNFSGTIEIPEAYIPDVEQEIKNKQQQRISSFSSKKLKAKKKKKAATEDDDATQESSKKGKPQKR